MLRNLPDMFCILATTTWENPETGIYLGYAGFTFHNLERQGVLDNNFASRALRKNMDDRWKWFVANGKETWEGCPYPEVDWVEGLIEEYGMCDDYQQILDKWPFLVNDEREYLIHVLPIKRNPQGKQGFRPHKNGSYIGAHEAVNQHEYFDHSGVDMIYLYHIYRFPLPGENLHESCS